MATTAIDTLRYARRLKAAGVPDHQAEEMADALGAELVENLVTKADLDAAVTKLQGTHDAAVTKLQGTHDTAITKLQGTHDAAITRIQGTLLLLKWMIGFILAFVVAIAWRVF